MIEITPKFFEVVSGTCGAKFDAGDGDLIPFLRDVYVEPMCL